MKIAIGSDHAGFELKNRVKSILEKNGQEAEDMGPFSEDPVDYPDFAKKVCESILDNRCARGILVCGSGVGMSICANRYKGIRAVLCTNLYLAEYSRRHNDSNVLCLPGRLMGPELAEKVVSLWLETAFEGGRHEARVKKMDELG